MAMSYPTKKGETSVTVSNTEITVKRENMHEFFQTMSAVSEKIRCEMGCISFRLFEESGKENTLMLVGEWDNKACWEEHCKGENFAVLRGSACVLGVRSRIEHKLLSVLDS